MAKTVVAKPLGLVLRKAGLVSSKQVEKALKESLVLPKCKIGEILAIRGLIKPQTADFFAEIWPRIVVAKKLQPLGHYLKAASLINEQEVTRILQIQQGNTSKFGKIAVEQGLISQTTLDFFIEHLHLIKTGEIISIYPEAVALELDNIESYILNNTKCEPVELLQKYDKIIQQGTIIARGDLIEQELLASGIVVLDRNVIRIAQPQYLKNFNESWIEKELAKLQPYNQIRLKMFGIDQKADIPYKVINAVNSWTNHQPCLTQKIYQLIRDKSVYITPEEEELVVEDLIYQHIIDDWQRGAAAKHLTFISDRLNETKFCSTKALLKTYKKIWQLKEINFDNSLEQMELLRIGLIELKNNRISVSNLIYQAVFDRQWVEERLDSLEQPQELMLASSSESQNFTIPEATSNNKKNKLLFIIAIIAILIAIPLSIKLLKKIPQTDESIEQGNNFLEAQYSQKSLTTSDQFIAT